MNTHTAEQEILPAKYDMRQAIPQTAEMTALNFIDRVLRDTSIPMDRLREAFELRRELKAEYSKTAFDAALAELQPELPVIDRNGRIEIRAKASNGERTGAIQQSSGYALWEDINEGIKPFLAKHGFGLRFITGLAEDGRIKVTCILSHREGHREETSMILPHDSSGSKNAVQAIGSSTSYGKRYTASAILNLTSRMKEDADDDGKKGGGIHLVNDDQVKVLQTLITNTKSDIGKFLAFFKVGSLSDLPQSKMDEAVKMLNQKAKVPA